MDYRKQYESLNFKDDFMFGVVMSDVGIAKRVLSVILAEEIPDIQNCELQKSVQNDVDSHGVRYDVYIQTDNGEEVYDVEMQTSDDGYLRKRSRYYLGSSDMDFLKKGKLYKDLPKTYIIFICDFDLFGKGRAVYKFENYCVEEGIPLEDKAYKIFLNTTGKTSRKELQNLMDYIKNNIPNDQLTRDIQNEVVNARHSDKLFSSYIKEQQNAMILEEKGRAKGRAEGRKEGRIEARTGDIKRMISKGLSMAEIIDLLGLSSDEVTLYFGDAQTV